MTRSCFLYKVTNLINSKEYIGVTYDIKRRMRSHKIQAKKPNRQLLKTAIQEYGYDNFEVKILCESDRAYCHEMEIKAIEHYNTLEPNGYNVTKGGMGSLGVSGEKSGTWGRKGSLHPLYNKKGVRTGILHTEETKLKMKASHANKKKPEGFSEKMRQIALNRPPEVKERIANALREAKVKKKQLKEGVYSCQ